MNSRLAMSANTLRTVTIADRPTSCFKCSIPRDLGAYVRRAAVALVSESTAPCPASARSALLGPAKITG